MFILSLGTVKLPHIQQNESGKFKLFLHLEAMVVNFCIISLDKSQTRENKIITWNIFLLLNVAKYN